jgi:hypothetical protein
MLTIDRTTSLKNNWSVAMYEENPPKEESEDESESEDGVDRAGEEKIVSGLLINRSKELGSQNSHTSINSELLFDLKEVK